MDGAVVMSFPQHLRPTQQRELCQTELRTQTVLLPLFVLPQTDLLNASARLLDHQLVHHGLEADAHHDGLGSRRETSSAAAGGQTFSRKEPVVRPFFFYLLAGDGDPLEAVLAHQVLEGQLQFHVALGRAGGVAGAVGHGDLLQETKRGMPPLA